MRIIVDRCIVECPWLRVADDEPVPESGPVLVSLDRYRAEREALVRRGDPVGVRAPGETEAEELAEHAEHLDLIALELPKFTDGRAYTTARLLRERYRYGGQLRAVGNVLRDQLFYLSRCGFDAFELTEGKDLEAALTAFDDFSVVYQPATDEPQPLWRRHRLHTEGPDGTASARDR